MKFIVKVMDKRLEVVDKKEDAEFDLLPIMLVGLLAYLTC